MREFWPHKETETGFALLIFKSKHKKTFLWPVQNDQKSLHSKQPHHSDNCVKSTAHLKKICPGRFTYFCIVLIFILITQKSHQSPFTKLSVLRNNTICSHCSPKVTFSHVNEGEGYVVVPVRFSLKANTQWVERYITTIYLKHLMYLQYRVQLNPLLTPLS